MGDIPDWCCAAGVCCDMEKRVKALEKILTDRTALTHAQAHDVAVLLTDNLDMMPKAAGLQSVIAYVQAHPYKG